MKAPSECRFMTPLKKDHWSENLEHYDPYYTVLPYGFHSFWQVFEYFQ